MRLLIAVLVFLWVVPAWAGHPPAKGAKKLPPSKAAADLKAAKKLLDEATKTGDKTKEAQGRELLLKAKKTLAAEGRYACCITDGGCDECAFEMHCPCGQEVSEGKEGQGVCKTCYEGWQKGKGAFEGVPLADIKLAPPMKHGEGMEGMGDMPMQGAFGDWAMAREGSGTSWLPDSSPMYGSMGMWRGFQTMLQGYGYGVYTDQGGPRGESKAYISSQLMGMAWKRLDAAGANVAGARLMLSADPATMGTRGYPLLFQTGETAFGQPLVDRQHPHDLLMELAGTYARRLTPKGGFLNLYVAPVGEPALGPTAFPHRPSAFDNPEATLGHHWFDSTHITSGVATIGLATNAVKVEGSVFTGREPDEHRYDIDRMRWDSYSGRVTVAPTRNLSAQISHGFLKSPEALEPDANQQRTTISATYNLPVGESNWQTTAGWARDRKYTPGEPMHATDAYLLESAFLAPDWTAFGRFERVGKDELFPVEEGNGETFNVSKFTLGGVRNIARFRHTEVGAGGSVSFYAIPGGLKEAYGSSPVSFNVFLRVRTGKM